MRTPASARRPSASRGGELQSGVEFERLAPCRAQAAPGLGGRLRAGLQTPDRQSDRLGAGGEGGRDGAVGPADPAVLDLDGCDRDAGARARGGLRAFAMGGRRRGGLCRHRGCAGTRQQAGQVHAAVGLANDLHLGPGQQHSRQVHSTLAQVGGLEVDRQARCLRDDGSTGVGEREVARLGLARERERGRLSFAPGAAHEAKIGADRAGSEIGRRVERGVREQSGDGKILHAQTHGEGDGRDQQPTVEPQRERRAVGQGRESQLYRVLRFPRQPREQREGRLDIREGVLHAVHAVVEFDVAVLDAKVSQREGQGFRRARTAGDRLDDIGEVESRGRRPRDPGPRGGDPQGLEDRPPMPQ